MNDKTLKIINELPQRMVNELLEAETADEVQKVFQKWANKGGYVEVRSRSAVWCMV